jgi:hypothetical protein
MKEVDKVTLDLKNEIKNAKSKSDELDHRLDEVTGLKNCWNEMKRQYTFQKLIHRMHDRDRFVFYVQERSKEEEIKLNELLKAIEIWKEKYLSSKLYVDLMKNSSLSSSDSQDYERWSMADEYRHKDKNDDTYNILRNELLHDLDDIITLYVSDDHLTAIDNDINSYEQTLLEITDEIKSYEEDYTLLCETDQKYHRDNLFHKQFIPLDYPEKKEAAEKLLHELRNLISKQHSMEYFIQLIHSILESLDHPTEDNIYISFCKYLLQQSNESDSNAAVKGTEITASTVHSGHDSNQQHDDNSSQILYRITFRNFFQKFFLFLEDKINVKLNEILTETMLQDLDKSNVNNNKKKSQKKKNTSKMKANKPKKKTKSKSINKLKLNRIEVIVSEEDEDDDDDENDSNTVVFKHIQTPANSLLCGDIKTFQNRYSPITLEAYITLAKEYHVSLLLWILRMGIAKNSIILNNFLLHRLLYSCSFSA